MDVVIETLKRSRVRNTSVDILHFLFEILSVRTPEKCLTQYEMHKYKEDDRESGVQYRILIREIPIICEEISINRKISLFDQLKEQDSEDCREYCYRSLPHTKATGEVITIDRKIDIEDKNREREHDFFFENPDTKRR